MKDPGPTLEQPLSHPPKAPIEQRFPVRDVKPPIEPERFTTQGDFSTKFNIFGHK